MRYFISTGSKLRLVIVLDTQLFTSDQSLIVLSKDMVISSPYDVTIPLIIFLKCP